MSKDEKGMNKILLEQTRDIETRLSIAKVLLKKMLRIFGTMNTVMCMGEVSRLTIATREFLENEKEKRYDS